jgi:Tyrosyl-tRNA synthetase
MVYKKCQNHSTNYIGIDDKPDDMFGPIMSISDDLMWRYLELLSFDPPPKLLLAGKQKLKKKKKPTKHQIPLSR